MTFRSLVRLSIIVTCLIAVCACASSRPRSKARSPETMRPGSSILANTKYDVKTLFFIDEKNGRYSDYFGGKGRFAYTYEKDKKRRAILKTWWVSDLGKSGETTVSMLFKSGSQGQFTAREKNAEGDRLTQRGRFSIKQPIGADIVLPPAPTLPGEAPKPTPTPTPTPPPPPAPSRLS